MIKVSYRWKIWNFLNLPSNELHSLYISLVNKGSGRSLRNSFKTPAATWTGYSSQWIVFFFSISSITDSSWVLAGDTRKMPSVSVPNSPK